MIFTLRGIAENVAPTGHDHMEVIAVDNWCDELVAQNRDPDRGHDRVQADGKEVRGAVACAERMNPWLKVVRYSEKLSHWGAKIAGIEAAQGDMFLFLDAHVMLSYGAIYRARFWHTYMVSNECAEPFTLHMPLTYHILETKRLIYALVDGRERGDIAYTFAGHHENATRPYEVPCMSTCGMLLSRETYEHLLGWPPELGIYGGGEHYMNFVGAVLGVRKYIIPDVTCHHHGDKRGYHWNYTDNMRNRMIAAYCFGGEPHLDLYLEHKKGKQEVKDMLREDVVRKLGPRRENIASREVEAIDDWLDRWKGNES